MPGFAFDFCINNPIIGENRPLINLDNLRTKKRYTFGSDVNVLPQHKMCSGSSGGVVDKVDISAVVVKCNSCGERVRIDQL